MIQVDAKKPVHFCDGLTRRDFLHAGSLTALGLGLPAMEALASAGAVSRDRDVSCILLFLVGGPSQLDTWDMKPDAPEEVRGPFRPIATKVPGLQISEIFPRLATMMDQVSLVRSVYHTAAAVHDTGHQMMQTGRLFSGGIEHPHYGCVVAKYKGSRNDTPPNVLLPRPIGPTGGNLPHGHAAGYLGKSFDPLILNADPNDKAFQVPDLRPPDYVTAVRESRRRSLRAALDGAVGSFESSADARLLDSNFASAFKLMSSPQARAAFDIAAEPVAVRDRYGRTRFGQSCLLARRLIEGGVRFVTITDGGWDTHANNFKSLKQNRMPPIDQALPELLTDLDVRGLLDTTLVVWLTDFGRTPKINAAAGRDHWATAGSIMMAGAGVPGGHVLGRTDDEGGRPTHDEYRTEDIGATIYSKLGIPLDLITQTPDGRPILLNEGRPIREWM
jgi:Protein of unknown function (DUF1501)